MPFFPGVQTGNTAQTILALSDLAQRRRARKSRETDAARNLALGAVGTGLQFGGRVFGDVLSQQTAKSLAEAEALRNAPLRSLQEQLSRGQLKEQQAAAETAETEKSLGGRRAPEEVRAGRAADFAALAGSGKALPLSRLNQLAREQARARFPNLTPAQLDAEVALIQDQMVNEALNLQKIAEQFGVAGDVEPSMVQSMSPEKLAELFSNFLFAGPEGDITPGQEHIAARVLARRFGDLESIPLPEPVEFTETDRGVLEMLGGVGIDTAGDLARALAPLEEMMETGGAISPLVQNALRNFPRTLERQAQRRELLEQLILRLQQSAEGAPLGAAEPGLRRFTATIPP